MKILLTGASGFVGQHLWPALCDDGYEVTRLANSSKDTAYTICDITKYEQISELVTGHDLVVHLACLALPICSKDPGLGFEVNVTGTNNIARACVAQDVNLLMVSTSEVYGLQLNMPIFENAPKLPVSIYGGYKLLGEQCCENWARHSGLKYATVRLFNIFGTAVDGAPRNTVETSFLRKALAGDTLQVNGGHHNSRDFLYIDDAILGLRLAVKKFMEIRGQVLNLGSGIETNLSSLAELACDVVRAESRLVKVTNEGAPVRFQANIEKAKSLMGFEPKTTLKEGLTIILGSLK